MPISIGSFRSPPVCLRSLEQHTVPGFRCLFPGWNIQCVTVQPMRCLSVIPPCSMSLQIFFQTRGRSQSGGRQGLPRSRCAGSAFRIGYLCCARSGPRTRDILRNAGVIPLTFEPEAVDHSDLIHLIFEYPPGLVPVADGVVPRVTGLSCHRSHDPSTVIVPKEFEDSFLEQIATCRACIPVRLPVPAGKRGIYHRKPGRSGRSATLIP